MFYMYQLIQSSQHLYEVGINIFPFHRFRNWGTERLISPEFSLGIWTKTIIFNDIDMPLK